MLKYDIIIMYCIITTIFQNYIIAPFFKNFVGGGHTPITPLATGCRLCQHLRLHVTIYMIIMTMFNVECMIMI